MITLICLFLSFATSIISGILGMAGGLILMGGLSFLLSVPAAMLAHGSAQFWANGIRAYTLRKHIHLNGVAYYLLGAIASSAGLSFLSFIPEKGWLFIAMGCVPFLAILLKQIRLDFTKPQHSLLCGATVTALQILAGVAGPLLDVFFVKTPLNRHQIVATKSATQTLSHSIKFFYYFRIAGESALEVQKWYYLAVIPAALFGTRIGVSILDGLSDSVFMKWTRNIVLILGAIYLARGFYIIQF